MAECATFTVFDIRCVKCNGIMCVASWSFQLRDESPFWCVPCDRHTVQRKIGTRLVYNGRGPVNAVRRVDENA